MEYSIDSLPAPPIINLPSSGSAALNHHLTLEKTHTKQLFLCLMLIVCFFASGCRTFVPPDRATIHYDRNTFPEKLQQDIGVLDEPILQHGRCTLYQANPDTTIATDVRFCTYALTENALLVQEWDIGNTKYTRFLSVNLAQLTSVDLAFSPMLLHLKQVKLLEPQRLIAISAVIDKGGSTDVEATEKMFQMIKARGIPLTGDNRLLRMPPGSGPDTVNISSYDPYDHYPSGRNRRHSRDSGKKNSSNNGRRSSGGGGKSSSLSRGSSSSDSGSSFSSDSGSSSSSGSGGKSSSLSERSFSSDSGGNSSSLSERSPPSDSGRSSSSDSGSSSRGSLRSR